MKSDHLFEEDNSLAVELLFDEGLSYQAVFNVSFPPVKGKRLVDFQGEERVLLTLESGRRFGQPNH